VIDSEFLRDFFGCGPSNMPGAKYERSVVERALKLCEGCRPEANIAPYLNLIKAADLLKLDVVKRA
jgi:hypothetical protein